jgi:hypothetical protein
MGGEIEGSIPSARIEDAPADRPPNSRSFGRFERRIIDRSVKTPAAPQSESAHNRRCQIKPNRKYRQNAARGAQSLARGA